MDGNSEYDFGRPITILSDSANGAINGNKLIVRYRQDIFQSFFNGVIRINGTVSSLTVVANTAFPNRNDTQLLSFAVNPVPEPDTYALVLGALAAFGLRRRKSI